MLIKAPGCLSLSPQSPSLSQTVTFICESILNLGSFQGGLGPCHPSQGRAGTERVLPGGSDIGDGQTEPQQGWHRLRGLPERPGMLEKNKPHFLPYLRLSQSCELCLRREPRIYCTHNHPPTVSMLTSGCWHRDDVGTPKLRLESRNLESWSPASRFFLHTRNDICSDFYIFPFHS